MSKKHKYTYFKVKHDITDWKTGYFAPERALLTEKEIARFFPMVNKLCFTECLPMTTDDFYWSFGNRFEYGDPRRIEL